MTATLLPNRTPWRFLVFLGLSQLTSLGLARAETTKPAVAPAVLEVRGDLPKPGTLRQAELAAMAPATFTWVVHGQTRTVLGVPLATVLRHFGWEPGVMSKTLPAAEKRVGYKRVVVATATDGFQAVFSAAEVAPGMGKTQAVLAWMVDGKPLSATEGPLRLVVISDDEPSRSIHHLQRLDVVDMRRIVPVTPVTAAPAAAAPAGGH